MFGAFIGDIAGSACQPILARQLILTIFEVVKIE